MRLINGVLWSCVTVLCCAAVYLSLTNETGHMFGNSLELSDDHKCPEDECPTFWPGGCMNSNIGYIFALISVLFFGTNFIPVKWYDTGDGMFYQWVMCSAIWCVGFIVLLIRRQPDFYPLPILGGFLWATGNVLCVPIINFIGLGMGLMIWGCTSMILGWATGTFGLFGLDAAKINNRAFNYVGVFFAIGCLLITILIKPEEEEEEEIVSRTPLNTMTRNSNEAIGAPRSNNTKRFLGIAMAMCSGIFFGGNFDPPTWVMNNKENVSQAGIDYVFAHFCGIYVTSTFWFVVYSLYQKNKPQVYSEALLPTLISGVMWAVAQISWFVANDCLSLSVSYPIITGGPGIIGSLVGIYFGEIKGTRNFSFLGVPIALGIIADVFIAMSR